VEQEAEEIPLKPGFQYKLWNYIW